MHDGQYDPAEDEYDVVDGFPQPSDCILFVERPVDIIGKEDNDDEAGQPGEIHEYSNQIAHLGKTVLVDEVAYIEERENDLWDDDL